MTDKKSEISLDEVLSSIKQMVVDSEPPVLDLTDMVAEDGSVVKVGESDSSESMGAFLKLAQENADIDSRVRGKDTTNNAIDVSSEKFSKATDKNDILTEIFKDIARPEIKKWLEANMSNIVKASINRIVDKWLGENLSRLAGNIVEREICDLLKNHRN